jgi:DNA-binding CsgD family transcriptional regulator
MQVLQLLCAGYTTKAIGTQLGITCKTAATHRYTIFDKAGVKNSVLLLRWALKKGLIFLDEL